MTLVVTASFLFDVPLRWSILAIGMTVVIATFVLGIHWLPDMIAGFAVGLASMLLAYRLVRRRPFLIFQRDPWRSRAEALSVAPRGALSACGYPSALWPEARWDTPFIHARRSEAEPR